MTLGLTQEPLGNWVVKDGEQRAETIVAVVVGAIGYLMVLRRQSFAGHTLALIGFPGAAGATWLGLNAAIGYFRFCVAGALIIAVLPGGRRPSAVLLAAGEAGPREKNPMETLLWFGHDSLGPDDCSRLQSSGFISITNGRKLNGKEAIFRLQHRHSHRRS